jgi:phosphoribosylformylglycinamidine synthase
MPHPERFVRAEQHPRWTREEIAEPADGFTFFQNAVDALRQRFR